MKVSPFRLEMAYGKCGGKALMLCDDGGLEFDIVTSGNAAEIFDEMLGSVKLSLSGIYEICGDYCVEPRDENGQSTTEFNNIRVVKIDE